MTDLSGARSVLEGADAGSRELAAQLAQGQAALLLLECLMLVLVERGTMTAEQMVEAVDTVLATKLEMVRHEAHPEISRIAAGLLSRIGNSMAAARVTPSSVPRDS
jgi:hypothetical protein